MSTFDDLKEKAYTVAGAAADAAKQMAIVSKCRVQILAEQEKIRSLYAKLGKLYYKDYVTDEEPDEAEYVPLCDSISEGYRRISQLRDKMTEAKEDYRTMKENKKNAKKQKEEEEEQLINMAVAEEEPEVAEVPDAEEETAEELTFKMDEE